MRRHAATEPLRRRHSSTAFGIRLGSAQSSCHTWRCESSTLSAFAVALAVVSCAATMPAIIIECRYESVTTSGYSFCLRMPYFIQPGPDGSWRILSRIFPASCQKLPTACATATCSSGFGRPQVLTVCAIEYWRSRSMSSSGTPRKCSATVSGTSHSIWSTRSARPSSMKRSTYSRASWRTIGSWCARCSGVNGSMSTRRRGMCAGSSSFTSVRFIA